MEKCMLLFKKKKTIIQRHANESITLKLVHKGKGNKDGTWLPSLVYDIINNENKKAIGRCDLRIGMNDYMYYMGNIGYVIYPPYRGKHYAAEATILLFDIAKLFMEECIITCSPDNIASVRTCELSGCVFVEELIVPSDHELIRQNETIKRIYRKRLV
jgi:predicted acetyltransferase